MYSEAPDSSQKLKVEEMSSLASVSERLSRSGWSLGISMRDYVH